MTRRLLFGFVMGQLVCGATAIQRHIVWNQFGVLLKRNDATLLELNDFMTRHKEETELSTVDFRVLRIFDRCISEMEDLIDKLRQLKRMCGGAA